MPQRQLISMLPTPAHQQLLSVHSVADLLSQATLEYVSGVDSDDEYPRYLAETELKFGKMIRVRTGRCAGL